MPYRKIYFEKHQPFHIVSRAVDERKIFDREEACYRFVFQIYAANIGKPGYNIWRKDVVKAAKTLLHGESVSSKFIIKEHAPFVSILDWALVITHYHLSLTPNKENSIPSFIKKLNGGFAKYFNLKFDRKGTLFGSRYKSIPIKTDFQLQAVSRYISVINSLDVFQPGWREKGISDYKRAFKFLENYQFSSFPENIGKREAKFMAPKEIRYRYGIKPIKKEEYIGYIKEFLKERSSPLKQFKQFFIE